MTPDDYCQQKTAQSGSSFYYSFLFLPPPRRRAITAFYAFCREVDDVVDECTDLDVARTKLAWWRTEVAALYEGKAKHPVALALTALLPEFNIEEARLYEIIDGMEMDLTQHRYADFSALQKYCYRVASVVGLVSAEIFGHSHPDTLKYAENLGMAFQLTNIIRDVGEDARRDRIYIPVDELARFNVTAADIMHARHSEAFVQLMQFQVERALNYYRDAMIFLPQQDRRSQRPGLVMAAIYRTLLEEIRADGMKVLNQRTSLTPLRKLWIAWRTWIKG
ncbi:MAG: presqualene diphosphate synthase HpnD [Betaproteobacteria bacterium]